MKIAVTGGSKDPKQQLDLRFGRCSYFLIYDDNGVFEKAVENKGQTASGGAGMAAAQQIVDEKVGVVITGHLGPNAFNMLNGADVKSYQCSSVSCDEAVKMYKENKLQEITQSGPSHAGMN